MKELNEFNQARDTLTQLINKLREEQGLDKLPQLKLTENFESDPEFGIEQVKNHFSNDQDERTIEFLTYFKNLVQDINTGLQ